MKLVPGPLPRGASCNQVYEPGVDPDTAAFIAEYVALCRKHRLELFVGSDDMLHIALLDEDEEEPYLPIEEDGVAFYAAGEVYYPEHYKALQELDKTA